MARKEAVFGMKVDTGNSVNEIKGLDKEMKELNDQMVQMEKNGETNTDAFKHLSKAVEETKDDMRKFAGDMEHLGSDILVEVTGSISKMEDRMYELALAGDTTSKEFRELQEQTAKYKKIIIETDRSIDALAEQGRGLSTALSISSGAVAGFQAYTGVTALLGDENEELLETITKLQAAQGVLNSIETIKQQLDAKSIALTRIRTKVQNLLNLSIGKGTKGMKIFRGALMATGIGALIVGIGFLIANFSKLSGWIKNAIAKFKEIGTGMKLLLYPITLLIKGYELIMGALQALGIIDSEETKRRKKNAEERVKYLEKESEAINDRYDFEIAKAKAVGKETYKVEQRKRGIFRKSLRTQVRAIEKVARLNGEMTDEQVKRIEELVRIIKASDKETTIAKLSEGKKQSDNWKKNSEKKIQDAKKEQDELNKILLEQASLEDEIYKMRLSAQDLIEQNISEKYDNLMAKAHGNAQLEKELIIQQETELNQVRKGFADKTAQDQANAVATSNTLRHSLMRESLNEDLLILQEKFTAEREALANDMILSEEEKLPLMFEIQEREKMQEDLINQKWNEKELADEKTLQDKKTALRNANLDQAKSGLNALSSLNSLVTDLQLKKAKGNSAKEEKIRKASFKRNKALQLSLAVIDGFKAITTSLSQSPIAIGPIPNPAGIASLAFAGITSAVNIAKIASSKYEGGGGGGGASARPSVPSVGASASSFAISDDTSSAQTELNADGTVATGSGQNKVVVVETDITNAVNNVAQIDELSTF